MALNNPILRPLLRRGLNPGILRPWTAGGGGAVVGADIDTFSADGILTGVGAASSNIRGICFTADGLNFYVADLVYNITRRYSLSAAFDLSSTITQEDTKAEGTTNAFDCMLDSSGDKFFQFITTGVVPWEMSGAPDISTATEGTNGTSNFSGTPLGGCFNDDGSKIYYTQSAVGQQSISEHDLSTEYDVTTLGSEVNSLDVSAKYGNGNPYSCDFDASGTRLYIVAGSDNLINQYNLSTAWDLSTAVFETDLTLAASSTSSTGIHFDRVNGNAIFVTHATGRKLSKFSV